MAVVGVVGATGLVGETMIRILEERSFPVDDLHPFASGNSEGKTVLFRDSEYPVEIISPEKISKGMYVFGATSAETAGTWVPMCRERGAVVIDNSSAYRMEPDVPLVVPEVNGARVTGCENLLANPNCSTIQLVVALNPLLALGEISWVNVCTYQAVSGAGSSALRELSGQQAGKPAENGPLFHENIVTTIGTPDHHGFCEEESKLVRETRKIMSREFTLYPSTARVPVRTGHTEAVTLRFETPVNPDDAIELMRSAPGIIIGEHSFGPVDVEGMDNIVVTRMRTPPGDPNVLQFWVIADNLRKGAALNAVQIAEIHMKK